MIRTFKEFSENYNYVIGTELFNNLISDKFIEIEVYPDRYGSPYLYNGRLGLQCDGFYSRVNMDFYEYEVKCLIDEETANFLRDNTGETVIKFPEENLYFWIPQIGTDRDCEEDLKSEGNRLIKKFNESEPEFSLDDRMSYNTLLENYENNGCEYEELATYKRHGYKTIIIRLYGFCYEYLIELLLSDKNDIMEYEVYELAFDGIVH